MPVLGMRGPGQMQTDCKYRQQEPDEISPPHDAPGWDGNSENNNASARQCPPWIKGSQRSESPGTGTWGRKSVLVDRNATAQIHSVSWRHRYLGRPVARIRAN